MEQLLYAIKSDTKLEELLYETLLQNEDGVYVLPELKSFGDYREFGLHLEIIERLCAALGRMGMECIFLDLPSGIFCLLCRSLYSTADGNQMYGIFQNGRRFLVDI